MGRLPDSRVQQQLLTAQRAEPGCGAKGRRGATLIGSFGTTGVYPALLAKHLTTAARRKYFDGSRAEWHVLANMKTKWQNSQTQ